MKRKTKTPETITAAFLTKRAASKFTSLSQRTLDELRSRGELPSVKISARKILFRVADLEQFMAERRVA